MKKIILTATIALLTLASCKKDYTCSCTQTFSYSGGSSVSIYTKKIEGATKKQASYACSEAKETETDNSSTQITECKLSK